MSWDTNNGGNNDSWGASNAGGGAQPWDPNAQPWDSGNVGGGGGGGGWDSGNAGGGDSSSNQPTDNSFNQGGDSGAPPARPRGEITAEMKAHRDYKWASNRARYEYNENTVDKNGMGKRDEELENELFEANSADQQTTLDFSKYERIPVRVERGSAPPPIKTFDDADLNPAMKENVRLARYVSPTPVQTYSIPIVTAGKDLMACAQTGSGKTAAFLIPSLSALFTSAKELQKPRPAPYEYRTYKAEPLILIIAPTRELCSQIFDECRRFTYRSCLRPCAVYGGADSIGQIRQLERGCDVLAAAPGRLMDFIERGKIGLNRVKYLILDEADRMLDMGFEAIIRQLVQKKGMPADRQTLMFSATFPRAIRALARDFLKPDYLFLKVGRVGGTSDSITQKVMYVEEDEKREALRTLLNSQPPSRTLIFVETKRSADSLDQYLYERSFPSTSIHGDRTQMEREDALLAFKSGQCPILVATAVAARGIDIRNVMHVINYDMPNDMDEYIHRIGRTARVGKSGLATSFYNDRSEAIAPELTKLLKECKQQIPDFLGTYVTDDTTFDEDLDDQGVEAPHYANQEYVPMERNVPGAPQGFNNASGTGAADGAWNAGESSTPGWENSGGDGGYGGGSGGHAPRDGDWNCPSCSASNFARRTECFKCGTAGGNGGGGGGGGGGQPGKWPCPDCGINNFPRRTECFKCKAARPEGMGDQNARGPRPRREGDWDCPSCSAVNFHFRDTCFKCQASKDGAADGGYGGGDTGYGDSSYGQSTFDSSAAGGSSEWNPSAAASGWGGSAEPAAPAASNDGGWGEPAAQQSSPAPASNGWGAPAAAPAPAATPPQQQSSPAPAADGWGGAPSNPPAAGGWGDAPAASSGAGWN